MSHSSRLGATTRLALKHKKCWQRSCGAGSKSNSHQALGSSSCLAGRGAVAPPTVQPSRLSRPAAALQLPWQELLAEALHEPRQARGDGG